MLLRSAHFFATGSSLYFMALRNIEARVLPCLISDILKSSVTLSGQVPTEALPQKMHTWSFFLILPEGRPKCSKLSERERVLFLIRAPLSSIWWESILGAEGGSLNREAFRRYWLWHCFGVLFFFVLFCLWYRKLFGFWLTLANTTVSRIFPAASLIARRPFSSPEDKLRTW